MLRHLHQFFQHLKSLYKEIAAARSPTYAYRVVELEKNNKDEYIAVIQVTGKNATFKAAPKNILADDKMTEQFSPKDVRTLTYLGYMDLNAPKYRILAEQNDEDRQETVYAVYRKGDETYTVKTAAEISADEEILASLDQKDAHRIGFATATEQMLQEELQKAKLRAQLEHKKKNEV